MGAPQVVEIFGNPDIDPVPCGIRVGNLIKGLRLLGTDPHSAALGRDIDEQLHLAMTNLQHCVERGGATLDNVAQVSFFVKDRADLKAINSPWVETFPDDQDRPTYKFMQADLPGGQLVALECFAVVGARRRVLQIPNVAHTNPIPLGVRIGNMLFSSRVLPYDAATGKPADNVERQAECLFANVRTLLAAGGAKPEHITQGRLFLVDRATQTLAEQHWHALVGSGPSLHTVQYGLAPALQVMLEFIAVVED
ncbi:MAG: RidA family protein [Chloroflexi bacterium]|nr:RidA family protein [Chloroflexota bacterium]